MFLGDLIIWFSTVWLCLLGWWITPCDTWGCKVWAIKDNVFGTYQLLGTFSPSLWHHLMTHGAQVTNVICLFPSHYLNVSLKYDYGCCYYLKKFSYLPFHVWKMIAYVDRYLPLMGKAIVISQLKKAYILKIGKIRSATNTCTQVSFQCCLLSIY